MMTRRDIIKRCGALTSLFVAGDALIFGMQNCYPVVIWNTSKSKDGQGFDSADGFWETHHDSDSEQLNRRFMAEGRLKKTTCYLSSDKKSVFLVKYYRSKEDHEDYVKELAKLHQTSGFGHKANSKVLV